jgi:putative phosphoesterase
VTTLKILVFSDSHRSRGGMYDAILAHKPDQVIHLGDLVDDVDDIACLFPQLPFCSVAGNCDGWCTTPTVRNITLAGKRFLIGHGHLWRVKAGYEAAIAEGRKAKADVLLFGHTHTPHLEQLEDGMWVMNPGSARSSYGLITIVNGNLTFQLMTME